MATLADIDIKQAVVRGDLKIEPWDRILEEGRLQPASVDLTLGNEFLIPKVTTSGFPFSKPLSFQENGLKPEFERVTCHWKNIGLIVNPGQFLLGTTVEKLTFGARIRGDIAGKSTIGRWGVCVHVPAGFFDPGFSGQATLEIVNFSPNPVELVPGMRICQMVFTFMNQKPRNLYGCKELGSHYQGQMGTTGPR